ncbi:MAG: patatin family protein [Faecousia sp.]
MKTGIVDVGGGLRGIYAAGVLDYCMDHGISFDLGIGVSAGSANLSSYCAHQRGRNYRFYTDYAFRKEYMSWGNFLSQRSYVDLDYVYGTLSCADGENPLDYAALRDNPMEFYVVATDAETGQVHYFDKTDIRQDNYDIMKASSAIPFVCKPYEISGRSYYDGALSDPVPVEKVFSLGCGRVVLLLTKPERLLRTSGKDEKLAAFIRHTYPAAAQSLCQRAKRYNDSVALARLLARQGKVLVVAPKNTFGVDTLTRDRDALEKLYREGYADGEKIETFLNQGR